MVDLSILERDLERSAFVLDLGKVVGLYGRHYFFSNA